MLSTCAPCLKATKMTEPNEDTIDWQLTTFEGARREQMRRWSQLPLERIVAALEEMEDLAGRMAGRDRGKSRNSE